VSAVSSKMIRKSKVKEQAYDPYILPLSLCVLSEGAKGSFFSFSKTADNLGSRSGVFVRSLDEARRNCFLAKSLNKLLLEFPDCFHMIAYGLKFHRWFLFSLGYSFNKSLALFLSFKKVVSEIFNLFNIFFREFKEDFVNLGYFHCFHDTMIICGCFFVNSKK